MLVLLTRIPVFGCLSKGNKGQKGYKHRDEVLCTTHNSSNDWHFQGHLEIRSLFEHKVLVCEICETAALSLLSKLPHSQSLELALAVCATCICVWVPNSRADIIIARGNYYGCTKSVTLPLDGCVVLHQLTLTQFFPNNFHYHSCKHGILLCSITAQP